MGLVTAQHHHPETILQSAEVDAFVVACFEDERPLLGAIGEFDWWLIQRFSNAIRSGVFSGSRFERVYMPMKLGRRQLHFLVLGQGTKDNAGRSVHNTKTCLKELHAFQQQFRFRKIGIFGTDHWDESVVKTMEGEFDLWIMS